MKHPMRLLFVVLLIIVALIIINDPKARPPIHLPSSPAVASAGAQITGQPTISANFIDQVLAAAHSPAAGTGEALYNDGTQYGINPAYALAFFKHESSFGTTGVARYTRSLGNIRCTAGYSCFDGFRLYSSWQAGYEDWYHMISTLYINQWHLTTLQQIIPVYAPASDHNDPQNYISSILGDVARWQGGKIR
jgi:hypothetical protein